MDFRSSLILDSFAVVFGMMSNQFEGWYTYFLCYFDFYCTCLSLIHADLVLISYVTKIDGSFADCFEWLFCRKLRGFSYTKTKASSHKTSSFFTLFTNRIINHYEIAPLRSHTPDSDDCCPRRRANHVTKTVSTSRS